MRRLLLALCLLPGCDRVFGLQHLPAVDGTTDARSDADDAGSWCYGKAAPGGLLEVCVDQPPIADRSVSGTIDTGGPTNECDLVVAQLGGPAVCVIIGKQVVIDTLVTARGGRALVIVAAENLVVSQTGGIDASSHHGFGMGPGANESSCPAVGDAGVNGTTGGGGAGGSFGSAGGNGGTSGQAASGATANAAIAAIGDIRGGCRGGNGGNLPMGVNNNGSSGGALYLIAGDTISIQGTLDASGEGGGGGPSSRTGGGGGGSGGFIALDAPHVEITASARLVANGGGGGGGADNSNAGTFGGEADLTMPDPFPAIGGAGATTIGGDGGRGEDRVSGVVNARGGNAAAASAGGGGGGGGGVGMIRVFATTPGIDPAAAITPKIP